MREPLLESAILANAEAFLVEPLQFFVEEAVPSSLAPKGLKPAVRVRAMPERKRHPGPDRRQVLGLADPAQARRRTAYNVNAGRDFSLLVGRRGRFPIHLAHLPLHLVHAVKAQSRRRRGG